MQPEEHKEEPPALPVASAAKPVYPAPTGTITREALARSAQGLRGVDWRPHFPELTDEQFKVLEHAYDVTPQPAPNPAPIMTPDEVAIARDVRRALKDAVSAMARNLGTNTMSHEAMDEAIKDIYFAPSALEQGRKAMIRWAYGPPPAYGDDEDAGRAQAETTEFAIRMIRMNCLLDMTAVEVSRPGERARLCESE